MRLVNPDLVSDPDPRDVIFRFSRFLIGRTGLSDCVRYCPVVDSISPFGCVMWGDRGADSLGDSVSHRITPLGV